jgi:hypothetical protein
MYITAELMKKYDAPDSLVEYFNSMFHDETSIDAVLEIEDLRHTMVYFLCDNFHMTEEQVNRCNELLGLVDCSSTYHSRKLNNCNGAAYSRDCQNCSEIRDAVHCAGSSKIYNGQKVTGSTSVYNSKEVRDSHFVFNSTKVSGSDNVCVGKNVFNSQNIFRSDNIFNSNCLRNCSRIENSYFCAHCNNSAYLMFCTDGRGDTYMIFNKQVTEERFNEVLELFKEDFDLLRTNLLRPTLNIGPIVYKYASNEAYSVHYSSVPPSFWEKLKSLDEFDGEVLYRITFRVEDEENERIQDGEGTLENTEGNS